MSYRSYDGGDDFEMDELPSSRREQERPVNAKWEKDYSRIRGRANHVFAAGLTLWLLVIGLVAANVTPSFGINSLIVSTGVCLNIVFGALCLSPWVRHDISNYTLIYVFAPFVWAWSLFMDILALVLYSECFDGASGSIDNWAGNIACTTQGQGLAIFSAALLMGVAVSSWVVLRASHEAHGVKRVHHERAIVNKREEQ